MTTSTADQEPNTEDSSGVDQRPPMIEADRLSKFYGIFAATREVSFKVHLGEVVAFLGPNGAGKSTTMKILTGYLSPSQGIAKIAGFDMNTQRLQGSKKLGYLPETGPLYPEMTPYSLLDFFAEARGMNKKTKIDQIAKAVELCALGSVIYKPINKLSKGYRQRVGMAQALIHEPEVLILDEPTSGLDPLGTRDMKDMIINLRDQGKTVVMCSHLLADVQDVCDRIAILYQGDLKELGRVDDLLKVSDETQVRAKGISPEAEAEIRDVIARHGGETLSIENPRSTLEDLFLNIVRDSENRPGIRMAGTAKESETESK